MAAAFSAFSLATAALPSLHPVRAEVAVVRTTLPTRARATGHVRRAHAQVARAARALTREKNANVGNAPDEVVAEFRKHFYDTQLFFDPFAGPKFAHYFFRAHEDKDKAATADSVHQLIEEATLFVDASHQCYTRLGSSLRTPTPPIVSA